MGYTIMKRSLKLWILVFISIRNFTDGCEVCFIAPTAWYYIKSLGQTREFLALVLGSFNVSVIISSPIAGYLADRFGHVKLLIVLTYVAKVSGNLIYSINLSAYFPLVGMIISGMADSSFGILMGQVALSTNEKDRARMFVFLEAMYCLGTAFGPALGSFITFNANIYGWKIDAGNSPGIVLTFIWLVSFCGALFLPSDFGTTTANEKEEVQMLQPITSDSEEDSRTTDEPSTIEWDSRVLCLFYLIFCCEVFCSSATFYTPLLALDVLHLKLIHVKFYFLDSSLFTLLAFIATYIASDYYRERKIFLFSMVLQILAISFLIAFAVTWDSVSYIHCYILFFYVTLGMPYLVFSTGGSLISKITDPKHTSFFQGCSFATVHLAIVASRIIASFMFTKTRLTCYGLGLAVFWLIGVLWYAVLYNKFDGDGHNIKS